MKEEFPRDHHITARISGRTKRKIQKLPYSYGDILEIGAEYVSKEINRLEWEKGELELELAELRKLTAEKEAKLHITNNRIRIVNPRKLDKDTLNDLISDTALDYAREIFDAHGKDSLKRIDSKVAKSSIFETAKEWGYDQLRFSELVRKHLEVLCNTD